MYYYLTSFQLKAVDPINGWKSIIIPSGDAALRSISTGLKNDLELCDRFSECIDILKRGSPDYKPQVTVNAEMQIQRKFTVVNVTSSDYTEEDIALAMSGMEPKTGLKRTQRLSMTRRLSKLLVTDTSIVMGQSGQATPKVKEIFECLEEDEYFSDAEAEVVEVATDVRRMNLSGQMSLPDIVASRDVGDESSTTPMANDSSNEGWTIVSPVETSPVIVEFPESEMIESIEKFDSSDTPMYRREDSSPEIAESISKKDFYSDTPKHRQGSHETLSSTKDDSSLDSNEFINVDSTTDEVTDHISNYSRSATPVTRRKSSRPEIINRQDNVSSNTPVITSSETYFSLQEPVSVDQGDISIQRGESNIGERPEMMLDSTFDMDSMTPFNRQSGNVSGASRKPSVGDRKPSVIGRGYNASTTPRVDETNSVPNSQMIKYTKREIREAMENAPTDYANLGKLNIEDEYLEQVYLLK
jgi:hypothetical protein